MVLILVKKIILILCSRYVFTEVTIKMRTTKKIQNMFIKTSLILTVIEVLGHLL